MSILIFNDIDFLINRPTQKNNMFFFMSDHVFVKLYLNKNRIHILFSAHAPRVAGINVRHVHSQKIGKTNN